MTNFKKNQSLIDMLYPNLHVFPSPFLSRTCLLINSIFLFLFFRNVIPMPYRNKFDMAFWVIVDLGSNIHFSYLLLLSFIPKLSNFLSISSLGL